MKSRHKGFQYTVRAVPEAVDQRLRQLARERGACFNTVAVESLAKAVGVAAVPANYDDLDALAGSWIEDPAVDRTLAGFGNVDRDLWK